MGCCLSVCWVVGVGSEDVVGWRIEGMNLSR